MNLEQKLIEALGEDELKNIGEQIAEVVCRYGLQKDPDICKELFCYVSSVIVGWNSL